MRGHGDRRVIAAPLWASRGVAHAHRGLRSSCFAPTLLDHLKDAGFPVLAIGKIEDLFAGRGVTTATHTTSDDQGMDEVLDAMSTTSRGLIFANLVDFDTQYGHRNDIAGYAANLERIDARLGELMSRLGPRDLLVVTADHGNDPTTPSTDHAREYVPIFIAGRPVRQGVDIGTRQTFADSVNLRRVWCGPYQRNAFLSILIVAAIQQEDGRRDLFFPFLIRKP